MKKIILIIIVLIMITGCTPEITEGEVINKEYKEAWTQLVIIPLFISNGKTTTTIMMPYWVFHPEHWKIDIEGKNKNNELVVEDFYINKELFNKIKIGDMFKFEENVGTREAQTYKIKKSEVKEEDFKNYKVVE